MAAVVVSGCTVPWTTQLVLPARHTLVRNQLVIHSDFPLPATHRLLEELAARRGDLQEQLGLPGSEEPIHVFLFESPEAFRAFVGLYHPGFPSRRAFFLETDTRLEVYAQWGDWVAEDLRHEVTHGYLHSVVPHLPLWLDEGLAEYSEGPRGTHGVNPSHLEVLRQRMARGDWRPDLARLERFEPTRDMSQEDYAECWAWVHFLLESGPEHRAMLREYLADVRRNGSGTAAPISWRWKARLREAAAALLAHLDGLLARDAGQPPSPRPGEGTPFAEREADL